jgi:hypothetical protein
MSKWHANWHVVDSVLAYSNATGAAFDVLLAIGALGNKNDGDWTFASRDRIALVARRDRRTVLTTIAELVALEELEYDHGQPSRFGQRAVKARYRVRTEVLRAAHANKFRDRLTGDEGPPVTDGVAPPVGDGVGPPVSGGAIAVTGGEIASDRWSAVLPTGGEIASTLLTDGRTELEQSSDQSAREENPRAHDDDAPTNVGPDQTQNDVGAMNAAFEDCRRAVDTSAGEE